MISVVVPIYNVAQYLPDCVKSIFAQDVTDMEVILVDDGSTDNSGALCDRYAKIYSNVKVIHQKNAGLSAARNTGIEAAKGGLITFVDSDDMLADGFISTALELAKIYQADFIAFSHVRCEAETQWPMKCPSQSEDCKPRVYDERVQKMQKFLIGTEIGTTAWAKVYRRELFETIRYPVGKYHEDVFTTYKAVDKAKRVVTTSQVGYLYRKSPNSITTSGFSPKRLDSVEGKLQQLAFIQENYPGLQKEAETGVIYACNQCMMLMAQAKYKNKEILDNFQALYRKYGKVYLSAPVSAKGKVLASIAMVNVWLAHSLFGIIV
ncbi:glycosyltransferase family 2 protein [Gemmiger formicilis]